VEAARRVLRTAYRDLDIWIAERAEMRRAAEAFIASLRADELEGC
jgi:hypothetical protein